MLREDLDKKKLELSRGNAKHIGILTLSSSALPHPSSSIHINSFAKLAVATVPEAAATKNK